MPSAHPAAPAAAVRRFGEPERWFTEGLRARETARIAQRCVECGRALPTRRTPYCSRKCRWKFHGRYFWDAARIYVLRRDRFTCRRCGLRGRKRDLEVDHIWELSLGGPALAYENLQTLCRACHRTKTVALLRSRAQIRALEADDDQPDWFPAD